MFKTFVFSSNSSSGSMPFDLKMVEGMSCVAASSQDLYNERDEAFKLLAKIRRGDFEDPAKEAKEFLNKRGFEHTYQTLID